MLAGAPRSLSRRTLLLLTGATCALGPMTVGSIAGRSIARAAPTRSEGGPGVLRVGESPPPLRVELVAGPNEVSLAHLVGRVVVLDFWASWCRPCRAIMPTLDALQQRFHGRGLSVIGVSRERRATIEAHLQREPVAYTIVRDVGGTQLEYGVSALPTLVLLDRRGLVHEVRVGGDDIASLGPTIEALLGAPATTRGTPSRRQGQDTP